WRKRARRSALRSFGFARWRMDPNSRRESWATCSATASHAVLIEVLLVGLVAEVRGDPLCLIGGVGGVLAVGLDAKGVRVLVDEDREDDRLVLRLPEVAGGEEFEASGHRRLEQAPNILGKILG